MIVGGIEAGNGEECEEAIIFSIGIKDAKAELLGGFVKQRPRTDDIDQRVEAGNKQGAVAESFDLEVDALRTTQYKSLARPMAARMLCKYAGMNQREAADELGYGTGASAIRCTAAAHRPCAGGGKR